MSVPDPEVEPDAVTAIAEGPSGSSDPDGGPAEPKAPAVDDDQEQAGADVAAVRKEAASYRRKLRAAEAERDAVTERVTAMQRREAERLATEGTNAMSAGPDLWAAGVTLEDLLDDNGDLDPEKVNTAREGVLATRPHWRRPPAVHFDGGARSGPPPARPDFAETLRRVAGSGA